MSGKGKDSLLGNKIAAGLLTAGLIFWGANRIAGTLVPDEAPKTPAIKITALPTASAPVAAVAAGLESIIPLIATGDVAKGEAFVQQQCSACHTLTPGGAAGVGPNLYGFMGAPMFSGSFAYSDAVKDKAKGNWNYDNVNAWLAAPQTFAPGTGMSYPGIKDTQMRADVVAYLRTLSATPLPLPSAAEVSAATAAAAAPAGAPASTPAPAAEAAPSIDSLFATADLAKGKALVMQQCAACHTFTKGGAAGVGPNLYGIVGAKAFSAPGFGYSAAVKAKAGAAWTDDTLSAWLENPMGYAPGTMMAYPGIKNAQTRADVIAYLNSNSASPEKLP